MNYGKRSTSKKRNALISRTSMLEKRAHVSFIRVLFTALIAVCVMVVCLGIGSFRGVIAGAPDVNNVDIHLSDMQPSCMMTREHRSDSFQPLHPTVFRSPWTRSRSVCSMQW